MSMILRRRAEVFKAKRITVLDPWFVSLLSTVHEDFISCHEKENFLWGSSLKSYVSGRSTGKIIKSEFLTHIDVVYVPMNWGNSHWVGLVINLKLRMVEILDPFTDPTSDEAVALLIAPVTDCIPWLLKRYISSDITAKLSTKPLTWKRYRGLYNNKGNGDCGSVSAKFLECAWSWFGRYGSNYRRGS